MLLQPVNHSYTTKLKMAVLFSPDKIQPQNSANSQDNQMYRILIIKKQARYSKIIYKK